MPEVTRRNLILGIAGIGGVLATGGVAAANLPASPVGPATEAVRRAEQARRRSGQKIVTARLRPRPVSLDLGGQTVETWGYGDTAPGPLLRAHVGDLLRVDVDNQLPVETSIHWHGIALRNDMDGVPGITQQPIKAGTSHRYEFTVPDPGTYFYHPHSGVQLDRGLYGVLVVDDPNEPGTYDKEWIVVLDDWVDGTGRTPDEVLKKVQATAGGSKGPGGMDMGSMGGMGSMNGEMQSSCWGAQVTSHTLTT